MSIGSFYFKQTPSGNLIGEFTNSIMEDIITESADKKPGTKGFNGEFVSSWVEYEVAHVTLLTIKGPTPNGKFSLHWEPVSDGTSRFKGEGMIVDGILIGYYKSIP